MIIPKVFHRLFLLILVVAVCVSARAQGFEIQRFHTSVKLEAAGTMQVEERISVLFTESKRGIFREIPYAYQLENRRVRRLKIDVLSTTDGAGNAITNLVTREGGAVNIRLGDSNIYLPAGRQMTFVIRYSVRGMLNEHGKEGAWDPWIELYWNSFGSQWLTRIQSAVVDISFPEVLEPGQVRLQVFPGTYGSTDSLHLDSPGSVGDDKYNISLTRSSAHIESRRSLLLGEDLTFVLGLPQGTVAGPSWGEKLFDRITPLAGFIPPVILLLLGVLFWAMVGRDPWAGRLQVAFEPPDNIGPAHFGTLIDERVDPRDITAAIVGLAVKGLIRIRHDEISGHKKVSIEVLKANATIKMDDFERRLYKLLVDTGTIITEDEMRVEVAPRTPALAGQIYTDLVDFGYFHQAPDTARSNAGVGMTLLGIILYVASYVIFRDIELWTTIIGGILSIFAIAGFTKLMPRATSKGASAKAQARGFAHFLREREHYHEWFAQKQAPQAIFEEYLPYAIALGLEAAWIKSFEGLLKESPNWYVGSEPTYDSFSRSMLWNTHSLSYSVSNPYRPASNGSGWTSGGSSGSSAWSGDSGFSSSSSGGGFSGGGFGGGGGGSW